MICAVVPTFNHTSALPEVVAALRAAGLEVIVVDDGSAEPAAAAIAAVAGEGVTVHRLSANRGKGAAVHEGLRLAAARGFTHAVQVDADGQHDLDALPALLAASRNNPDALVSGAPVYDDSMPLGRRIGRWITHFWVCVETLSPKVIDSMCGFRVYPLAATLALMDEVRLGSRMDFDTEVMVRLIWRRVPLATVPVKVVYPPGNSSNFRMLADNWRITRMHTRLVVALLLGRRRQSHWAEIAERGAAWGLRLTAGAFRLLGRRGAMAVLAPAVLWFWATGAGQRRASAAYLGRAASRQPGPLATLRHLLDFAGSRLDALAAWSGAIPPAAMPSAGPRPDGGALLVVSHHGNAELARALMPAEWRQRLTVLVHTRHAEAYNRVMAGFRAEAAARMVQVTEVDPATAVELSGRIERGEWIAMAGDRTPVSRNGRVCRVPFLGEPAGFPQGPWLLASLLRCPVWLLFCRREGDQWRLSLEPFAERVVLPRGRRDQALAEYCTAYAARLERECRAAPAQWYNFYDFWGAA